MESVKEEGVGNWQIGSLGMEDLTSVGELDFSARLCACRLGLLSSVLPGAVEIKKLSLT